MVVLWGFMGITLWFHQVIYCNGDSMVSNGTKNNDSMDYDRDVPPGFISHMAGWKIPELNGGL